MCRKSVHKVPNLARSQCLINSEIYYKLYNIDAPEPEICTRDAVESINYLMDLIGNQEVIIVERGTDRDDRPIADIWRCSDNLHVNQHMVDARHARWIE